MNDEELKHLTKSSRFFDAKVEGDFPEHVFPNLFGGCILHSCSRIERWKTTEAL